jgi:hypothetical protein
MASRHEETDRENYRRYNDQAGRRYRYEESVNEPYRRGSTADEAWSEGRGYRPGREDYGSGQWEGEGEAYGGRNRRFQNNLSDEAYGNQRYNYPQGFRSGEREGRYSNENYGRNYGSRMGRSDERYSTNYGSRGYGEGYRGGNYGSDYDRFGTGERNDYETQDRYGRDRNRDDYDRGDDRSLWQKFTDWLNDEDDNRTRRAGGQRGEYRGRGPKGYRRSDERIRDDVNDRLSDDEHLDASDIDVTVQDAVVVLSGTVNDRWDKRRAESIAENVSGVSNVENRIRIKSSLTTTLGTADQLKSNPTAKSAGGNA